jgi:3-isopropylmalate/(R)-2-methylmalate dehydratase small subunit
MPTYTRFRSSAVLLPVENIDTDQIIPARYLKVTDKVGIGNHVFHDWRYNADGSLREDFVLNTDHARSSKILVAGNNFGCGSSREHAPWALTGFGFRAVISTSFADIFRNNALKNGLLPIVVKPEVHTHIATLLRSTPTAEFDVDLASETLTLPDGTAVQFPIEAFSKHCLLNGVDEMGYIMQFEEQIRAFEALTQD